MRKYIWKSGKIPDSNIEDFWKHVEIKSKSECWNWIGYKMNGYGVFYYPHYQYQTASRVSWYLHYGEIPKNKLVCHHCDNPSCVNPDHLFLGSHKDNTQDMYKKGRNKIKPLRGEDNGNSRLTWVQVREIRKIWFERDNKWGLQSELSRKYKVDRQVIIGVVKNEIWKE